MWIMSKTRLPQHRRLFGPHHGGPVQRRHRLLRLRREGHRADLEQAGAGRAVLLSEYTGRPHLLRRRQHLCVRGAHRLPGELLLSIRLASGALPQAVWSKQLPHHSTKNGRHLAAIFAMQKHCKVAMCRLRRHGTGSRRMGRRRPVGAKKLHARVVCPVFVVRLRRMKFFAVPEPCVGPGASRSCFVILFPCGDGHFS